jgi:hypothetical protein
LVLRVLRHSRGLALFALLVITGSVPVSISALLHDRADDDCQPMVVLHDESAHRIGAARAGAPVDSQHCVVCHWLQSVQAPATTAFMAAPPADSHHLTVSALPLAGNAVLDLVAARAPPLS